jgi:predicted dehydrogenase
MVTPIYNVIIIGAGNIGAGYDTSNSVNYLTHAHAFTDHKGFNLLGFVDPNLSIAKKAALKWSVSYYLSIEEAFNENKIDVVSVAAPDEYHYDILKKLSKYRPLFVFSEKPFVKTIDEAKEILLLYKKKNIPAAINFKRRFIPEIIDLKDKIVNKVFGDFIFGIAYYGKGFIHNGSHTFDLLLFLLDKNWEFDKLIDETIDFGKNDPSYSLLLKGNRDEHFLIKALDSINFSAFEFDFIFNKGRIRITDLGSIIEEYKVKQNGIFTKFRTLEIENVIKTQLTNSLLFSVNHIYRYLNEGNELLCSFEETLRGMELMNKITSEIINGKISNTRR